MSQIRLINFNDLVLAHHITDIIRDISHPVVLSGGDMTADNDKVWISPVVVVLPTGVVMEESVAKSVLLPITTAANYTILYSHENKSVSGGNAAILEYRMGLLSPDLVPTSTIIGWVRYPGGSIPLSTTHFIPVRKAKIQAPNNSEFVQKAFFSPFEYNSMLTVIVGGNITVETDYDEITDMLFTRYRNNTSTFCDEYTIIFPFMAEDYQPAKLFVRAMVDSGAQLTFSLKEMGNGFEYIPPEAVINNTLGEYVLSEANILNFENLSDPALSAFASGKMCYVKVTMKIAQGTEIKLVQVGISKCNLPY